MFRAATAGVDSTPYVQQILGVGGEEDEGEEGQGDDGGAEAEDDGAQARAAAEEEARLKHE